MRVRISSSPSGLWFFTNLATPDRSLLLQVEEKGVQNLLRVLGLAQYDMVSGVTKLEEGEFEL